MGVWNVDDLAESMSVDLLYEWLAFYSLEPFGDEWLRHAIQCSQFYNAHRGKGDMKRRPADFMPIEQRPQSPQEMHSILQSIRAH